MNKASIYTSENGEILTVNGVVASDLVTTIGSNGVLAETSAATDKIAGIARTNDGTSTVINVITGETLVALESANLAGVSWFEADIAAKKLVSVYFTGTGFSMSNGGVLNFPEVARIVSKDGDKYIVRFVSSALLFAC